MLDAMILVAAAVGIAAARAYFLHARNSRSVSSSLGWLTLIAATAWVMLLFGGAAVAILAPL